MKTRKITINVPNELRLGQLLYDVLRDNGHETHTEISSFSDGKWTEEKYAGVDPYYIEDKDLLAMIDEWINEKENE